MNNIYIAFIIMACGKSSKLLDQAFQKISLAKGNLFSNLSHERFFRDSEKVY